MATAPELDESWPDLCNNPCGQTFCGTNNAPYVVSSYRTPRPKAARASVAGAATTTSLVDFGNSFTNLSSQEKESAYNDLHGCPDTPKEDPEVMAEKLARLDAELRKKVEQERPMTTDDMFHNNRRGNQSTAAAAYVQAYYQNKENVENRKFRLAFLRAELYNVKGAAERICHFFEIKLHLFGAEKLTEPILYQDLSKDDIDSLHSGALQSLPLNDSAGRLVLIVVAANRREKTIDNFVSGCQDVAIDAQTKNRILIYES